MLSPERIQERIDALGLSQNELAKRVGVSTQTIWKLATGHSRSSAFLHKIARELATTPEYLEGETDDPSPSGAVRATMVANEDDDSVEIDSIDLSFGLGGTFVDVEPGALEIVKAKFSRDWLRKFTHSPPELLFTTSGVGDSMTPTINDQDLVIVDRSERLEGSMGEKIWAIVFGGVGMIKRLRPMPDGSVKIMSDNQLVREELATDSDLYVVGRVVASVRRH
jgi:phage repressor protein C with HTH and peptisase S24 domain